MTVRDGDCRAPVIVLFAIGTCTFESKLLLLTIVGVIRGTGGVFT